MNCFIFILIISIGYINSFSKLSNKFTIKNLINKSKSKINYIKPKISIIIPIYNAEKYIEDYFKNLLNQSLKKIEIICLDYNSIDKSLFILKKFEKIDKRIIILSQYKENLNEINNNGINIAKGEYLLFFSIDIFFSKDMLYDIIKEADKENADIVIYGFEKYNRLLEKYFYENFKFQKIKWVNDTFNYSINPKQIFTSFYPFLWNKLFRHSFIKKNKLFFLDKLNKINLFFINNALIKASKIYLLNKYFVYSQEDILYKNVHHLNFYKDLLKLKKFLEESNLFLELNEAYKQFVKKVCIYFVKNNEEKNIYLYEKLQKKKFLKLGIDIIPSNLIGKEFHEKYLNHFYFKHINLINVKFEINIIKNVNYTFKPKVTVIIPVYNVEKYIIRCLDSIINQKLHEIEIIIVNDGSTDNSLQIVQNFTKSNNNILILSQDNRGLSEARNTGFKYSKGEYIYFIDGDDYLDENCLFDLYNEAIINNLDIIFFDAISFLDETREKIQPELINIFNNYLNYYQRKNKYEGILNGTQMFLQMKENKEYRTSACLQFIKKEFYINVGLSFYPGILHEDNLFSFIAILYANKTIHINKNYYNRRVHPNSIMTSTQNVKNVYGYFIVFCEMIKFLKKTNFIGIIRSAIINEVIMIRNRIINIYKTITQDEKDILFKKLTIYQEIIFKNIIDIIEYEKKIEENKNKIIRLNKRKKKEKIYFWLLLFFIFVSLFIIFSKKKLKITINYL